MPQHMAQALLPDPLPAPAPRRAHGSRGLRPAALRRCPHCAATQVRGAAGCSGEHFEHAEAAKAQRGRGTPAARRGRRTDAWCSSYRQLGFNNVGCAYQPPPPGSQASWLAACPQAGGSSRSPPHTLTCVCPGPRAWEVKTRRQVTGQRPRPQHGRRSPTVCESATAGRPLSGSSAVGRTTTAWRLAGDVCAQAHAPHRRGKDSAVCHSPEHVTGYLRPSGGVRARAG